MRVESKWVGREKEFLANDSDVFEEYNKNVDVLVKTSVRIIGKEVDNAQNYNNELESANSRLHSIDMEVNKHNKNLEELSRNHDQHRSKFIEDIKRERINSTFIHSDEELDELARNINVERDASNNALPDRTLEDIKKEIQSTDEVLANNHRLLSGIVDYYGNNFGRFSTNGRTWTPEFSKIYTNVKNSLVGGFDNYDVSSITSLTPDEIVGEFKGQFKKNPYSIYNGLWAIFAPPLAYMRKHFRDKNIINNISSLVESIKNQDIKTILLSMLFVTEWTVIFVLAPRWVLWIILALIGISPLLFSYMKKNQMPYIKKVTLQFQYFNTFMSTMEQRAVEQYDELVREVRDKHRLQCKELERKYNAYNKENADAKEQVRRSFDPNSIDTADIEREYMRIVNDVRTSISKLQAERQSILTGVERTKALLAENERAIQEACKRVLAMFEDEDSFPERADGQGKFDYTMSYAGMYALLNGYDNANVFGGAINYSDGSASTRFRYNDLVPKNILVNIEAVDIMSYLEPYRNKERIARELANVLNTLHRNNMAGLDSIRAQGRIFDTGEGIGFTKLYKLKLAQYNCKSTVIFYDSTQDRDYIGTVSKFITRNIFRSNFLTSAVNILRFNLVVENRTEVDRINPNNSGTEEAKRNLQHARLFNVISSENINGLYKDMVTKSEEYLKGVRELKVDDMMEYTVKKFASGSTPDSIDFLLLWENVDAISQRDLAIILQRSGGGQADGSSGDPENIGGIIPIIFLDSSIIDGAKPDKSKLDKLETIIKNIGVNNVYKIGRGATTLTKASRADFLTLIESARSR